MPQTLDTFSLPFETRFEFFFSAVNRFVRMVDEGKPRDWEDIAFRLLGMYSLSFLFAQLSSKVTRTNGPRLRCNLIRCRLETGRFCFLV